MGKNTKPKAEAKTKGSKEDPVLTGFEEIAKFFDTTHQKVRVVHMRKPMPQNPDGTLKPIKAKAFLKHCQGVLRCGEMQHLKFGGFPDSSTFKDAGKKSKK